MSRIRRTDEAQDVAERFAVRAGLGRRAKVRLGHDLHQRHAGPVEVDQRVVPAAVEKPCRVLLEVSPRDPDRDLLLLRRHRHEEPPIGGQGQGVLADLVALGQVGIEVVLALEADGIGLDLGVQGQPGEHDQLDRTPVDDRQGPGQTHADGAYPGVRGVGLPGERGRAAAAEHLRGRAKLGVDLDPDDGLERAADGHGRIVCSGP